MKSALERLQTFCPSSPQWNLLLLLHILLMSARLHSLLYSNQAPLQLLSLNIGQHGTLTSHPVHPWGWTGQPSSQHEEKKSLLSEVMGCWCWTVTFWGRGGWRGSGRVDDVWMGNTASHEIQVWLLMSPALFSSLCCFWIFQRRQTEAASIPRKKTL